jgi:hypothetical protein
MIAMIHFAMLVVTTIFAAAAALLFDWVLLRVAFHLMRPAAVRQVAVPVRSQLARGTAQLARAFAAQR